MIRHLSIVLCALAVFPALAQAEKPYLFSSPFRLSGIVTDAAGQPLPDVWINHAELPLAKSKTDLRGRFEIETRAPAIVFRKGGFQSRYLRVEKREGIPLTITLAGPASRMKGCSSESRCVSLKYFGSAFCLPRIRGVNVRKQGNDADYGYRSFWIATPNGRAGIRHGSGPMWGAGIPFDEDVWSAVEFKETSYQDQDGFLITDASGKTADGKCWRTLGHAFESVSYRGVSVPDAVIFDRLIDGVCINPVPFGLEQHN